MIEQDEHDCQTKEKKMSHQHDTNILINLIIIVQYF